MCSSRNRRTYGHIKNKITYKHIEAVKSELTIVVAPPVIVACLLLIWVCIAEVTPLKYPTSVLVAVDTATLPFASLTNPLDAVKFALTIVVAPPVMVACFPFSCVIS